MLSGCSVLKNRTTSRITRKYTSPKISRRRLQVAIIGSGPAGCYTADELLRVPIPNLRIDIYEKLPTPFGLVRSGVAPDHPEVKSVETIFEAILANQHGKENANVRLFGNVDVGKDITVEELRPHYDMMIFAYGAESDKELGIPGEHLKGVHSARSFVAWYNGLPGHTQDDFDVSGSDACIIGQGNVALDVARILAQDADQLKTTDIAEKPRLYLKEHNKLRKVHIVGRRGPVQAAFTTKELREIVCNHSKLEGCRTSVYANMMLTTEADIEELKDRVRKRQFELVKQMCSMRESADLKNILLHFNKTPLEFVPHKDDPTRVGGVRFQWAKMDGPAHQQFLVPLEFEETLETNLVFKSIGYKSQPITKAVPFDEKKGIIPNVEGRVVDGDQPLNGYYVVGWLKRGPSGILPTNKYDASDVVKLIVEDVTTQRVAVNESRDANAVVDLLASKNIQVVDYDGWHKIDEAERQNGALVGKPREKFVEIADMLALVK